MQDPYKLAEKYFKGLCSQEEAEAFLKWYFSEQGEEEIKRKIDVSRASIDKKHKKNWDPMAVFEKIQSAKNRSSLFISHKMEQQGGEAQGASKDNKVRTMPIGSHRWRYAVSSFIVLITLGLGILAYHFISNDSAMEGATSPEYVYKSNPAGQKSTIFLKDGSHIVLNSASSIQYAARFLSDERVIELHGEAFFEVARDSLRPFRVITNDMEITAIGTSFNIRSFSEEGKTSVGLVSGRVKVKDRSTSQATPIYLNPGEGVVNSVSNGEMVKVVIDAEKLTAWKNGLLYFEDEPIAEVLKTLERWYGVEIEMDNTIEGIFTGKFKNQSLEAVLEGISYSFSLDYTINGKDVRLTTKHNKK